MTDESKTPNEKSAGQKLYEATCAGYGEESNWGGVPAASKWRWEEKAESDEASQGTVEARRFPPPQWRPPGSLHKTPPDLHQPLKP